MKIEINRRKLLDILSVAQSAAGKDILANVKLSAGPNAVLIESTDGEIGLVLGSDCKCDRPGRALVSPQRLASILGPSTAEDVTIDADGQAVTIIAGRSKIELPSTDPDQFPSVNVDSPDGISVASDALVSAIRKTIFAVDQDSTRYQLGGVLMTVDGESLHLVGTDGRRLSTVEVEIAEIASIGSPIVPVKGLQSIVKTFGGSGMVTMQSNGASLQVASQAATLVCRLIEGRYPNWQKVIPADDWKHKIAIPAGAFRAALAQASVTTVEDSRGVELSFAKNGLTISSSGQDKGKSIIEMDIETDAKISTTIDWRFALDFVKKIGADDSIEFCVNTKDKPVVMAYGAWRYVVMPMSKG